MSETQKYNPEQVRDGEKRQAEAKDILARQKELWYDKKTPEGKLKLSQEWVKKAWLTPKMIQEICTELEIPNLNDPKAVEQAVKSWQEKNGMSGKNADGIMWWATLEKLDTVITEKHNTMNDEWLDSRLVSAGDEEEQEAKKIEEQKTFQKDMNQLTAELKDWNGIEDDRLPKGVGVDQDKQVLVKTDDKTQFWDANKDGGSWNSRAESLNNEQNIAIIKDVLSKLDTFEEGQEYVKSLGTSTAYTEKEMNEFNAILKGKGWELKMDDQGEFQEYALVDKKTESSEKNIAGIKDVLSKLDTFEEGQEYVKSLGTSTAYTEKEMNEFNAILKGKGWELKMDDQGEFQEYALVNVNKIEPALAETESGINEIKSVIEKWYSKDFKGLRKALTELGITSATISGKKLQTITLWDMLSAVISTGKVGKEWAEMLLNHFLWVHIRNGAMEAGRQIWDSMGTEVRNTAQDDINKQIEISQKFSSIIEKWGDATLGEIFDAWLTQLDGTTRFATAPVRYATAPVRWFIKRISSWFSGK